MLESLVKYGLLLLSLIAHYSHAQGEREYWELKGLYQGKNLYVMVDPPLDSYWINGDYIHYEISSVGLEIDFNSFPDLKYGDSVLVQVPKTSKTAKARWINPEAILEGGELVKQETRGSFIGQNLYVQNPFGSEELGFCVAYAFVNGEQVTSISSSAFDLKLSDYATEIGDTLVLKLFHYNDCTPRFIYKDPPYQTPNAWLEVRDSNTLHYELERKHFIYSAYLEKYELGSWKKVQSIELDSSEIDVSRYLTRGENLFRLRMKCGKIQELVVTTCAIIHSDKSATTHLLEDEGYTIRFSQPTYFEIHDSFNNLVRRGREEALTIHGLKRKLSYTLRYEDKVIELKIPSKQKKKSLIKE